jgi:hypothetical protein
MNGRIKPLALRDVASIIARNHRFGLERRIEYYSRLFQGARYVDDPVGDGRNGVFDKRAIVRFDGFDCQTYVETVLALARASNVTQFRKELIRIRYRNGEVDFPKRNHYLTLQWIPANTANGLLRDITGDVAPDYEREPVRRSVDMDSWLASLAKERFHGTSAGQLRSAWQGPRRLSATTEWLSLRHVIRSGRPFANGATIRGLRVNTSLLERIPRGAVLVPASENYVHMGIVARVRGELVFRQASRMRGSVVEHPLCPLLMMLTRFSFAEAFLILQPIRGAALTS